MAKADFALEMGARSPADDFVLVTGLLPLCKSFVVLTAVSPRRRLKA